WPRAACTQPRLGQLSRAMSSRPLAGSPTMPAEGAGSVPSAVEPLVDASPDAVDELNLGAAELDGDGELNAQRDAPVGGQAVLEGVMMRGVSNWAVAVRKPTEEQLLDGDGGPIAAMGEVEVTTFPLESAMKRHRLLRLPIIRGVVALGGSMVIGFRALEGSANAQLPAEEEEAEQQEIPRGLWLGTVVVALVLAIVLFFLI